MWSLCFSGSGACAARDVDHGHSNKVPYNYQCLGGSRAGAAFSHPAPARGDVHTGLSSDRSGGTGSSEQEAPMWLLAAAPVATEVLPEACQ